MNYTIIAGIVIVTLVIAIILIQKKGKKDEQTINFDKKESNELEDDFLSEETEK